MRNAPNAVELTVEQAWFVADTIGAGNFPWVLAITPPYADARERARFDSAQRAALCRIGVMSADGVVHAAVAEWIRLLCYCDRWLELRYVAVPMSARAKSKPVPMSARAKSKPVPMSACVDMMRGVVGRRGTGTVVALRNAHLVTFTALTVDHPSTLVPVAVAGLTGRWAADFDAFELPARVGSSADEQLRSGANVAEVMQFLGIPAAARPVVEAVYTGPSRYVELVAGERAEGRHATSEVGVGIVDSTAGRILVNPYRAADGEWISTFSPGSDLAIAVAIEQLTAALPAGQWFPDMQLTRAFT